MIDWLDNHGDVFLRKNTSIGKTLQRAKALQKSHEHFESVGQVGYYLIGTIIFFTLCWFFTPVLTVCFSLESG